MLGVGVYVRLGCRIKCSQELGKSDERCNKSYVRIVTSAGRVLKIVAGVLL